MRTFLKKIGIGLLIPGWLILIAWGFLYAATGDKSSSSSRSTPYSANELLIQFKSKTSLNISRLINSSGATKNDPLDSLASIFKVKEIIPLFPDKNDSISVEDIDILQIYLFKFNHAKNLSKLKKSFESLDAVEFAEVNHHYFAEYSKSKSSSTLLQSQLHEAARYLNCNHSVIIGIIDSGIDWKNKPLISNVWTNFSEMPDGKDNDGNGFVDDIWGWNFVDKDLMDQYGFNWKNRPIDDSGHGTTVAEIVNQTGNYRHLQDNGSAKNLLMILKAGVLSPEGKIVFSAFAAAQAIIYAADNGARVINLSWHGDSHSNVLQQAIDYAANKGCVIIAAAGDNGNDRLQYPAAFENVWSVTATDDDDRKLNESNFGHWIDIAAPGLNNAYYSASDSTQFIPAATAIAAANVSGLAGLLLSCEDIADSDSLKRRIVWSSDNIYHKNLAFSARLGAGRINVLRAINSQHLPNIIIQKLSYDLRNKAQYLLNVDIVPIKINIKNLSSIAQDIQIKLISNDPYLTVLKSKINLPYLGYQQEFTNSTDPFTLLISNEYPTEYEAKLLVQIATADGFSLEQTFNFTDQTTIVKDLALVNNHPLTLKWSTASQFVYYHIYRKEENQQSYTRLTDIPISESAYVDQTMVPNVQFFYYVTGIDSSGWESPASNIITVKVREDRKLLFYPDRDSLVADQDSIRFSVLPQFSLDENYTFQWQLNDKIIETASDSFFVLLPNSLSDSSNLIKVTISATDTVFAHSWHVNYYQKDSIVTSNQIVFSPESDTIIFEGDSLKIVLQTNVQADSSTNFRWIVNGKIDSSHQQTSYLFTTDYFSAGIDTIVLNYEIGDSTGSHQWLVTVLNRNRPPEIEAQVLLADTTIAIEDTLTFHLTAHDPDQDSLSYQWYINGRAELTAIDSFFTFFKSEKQFDPDTISAQISDNDTSLFHHWIVHFFNEQNQLPIIISCRPPVDSMLTKADSIQFIIHCNDPDGDTLQFNWSLNGWIDTSAHDSTYWYRNLDSLITEDTLKVVIADADTSIMAEWILRTERFETETPFREIHWLPERDSLIADSDSLIFIVQNASDSCRLQWKVNSQIDSSASDSIFIYHLSRDSVAVDTIQVIVFEQDSIFYHQWHIHYPHVAENRPLLRLVFKPEQETIMTSGGDSLKFSVSILEGKSDNLTFQWSFNNQLDTAAVDTIFYIDENHVLTSPDTIQLIVSRDDTSITHQWFVQSQPQETLPAPQLIFPVEGNHICEEDRLIWENDSSLAQNNPTGGWQYIVQLSNDTTFINLISIDTCSTTTITLDQLTGFEKFSFGKSFYWRVKIFYGYEKFSKFCTCSFPFKYFPQFAQITNFYGQKNENGSIDLFWSTDYEINCAGFNVYRSESQDNHFEKINKDLIIGQSSYTFKDITPRAGKTYYYKLEDICKNGRKKFHNTISITTPVPAQFSLSQNFPNPFNSRTSFKYEIPTASHVKIEVCNVLGRKVKILVNEQREAGFYTVFWDGIDDAGESVVSGIYFYYLITNRGKITRKMIVVR